MNYKKEIEFLIRTQQDQAKKIIALEKQIVDLQRRIRPLQVYGGLLKATDHWPSIIDAKEPIPSCMHDNVELEGKFVGISCPCPKCTPTC